MGNGPSTATRQHVASNGSPDDGDNTTNNNITTTGGGFRLPLYRGERDAFLPIEDINNGCTSLSTQPPLLSVEPRLSTNGEHPLISPLSNNVNHTVAETSNTPSVISSSDSSYSTLSTPQISPLSEGNNSNVLSSRHQRPNSGFSLPVPLQGPVPKRLNSYTTTTEGGIFDCVKVQPSAQQQQQLQQQTVATTNNVQLLSQKPHIVNRATSSGSLSSLFETCIKPIVDEEEVNEYCYNEDASVGSYYSSSVRRGSYKRSVSNSSSASNYSHNSYYNNTMPAANTSKSSLVSAFSSTSLSASFSPSPYYTEDEINMMDGDEPTYHSDLTRVRNYHVVTTAALPWFTGTAVNPLLRAGYLLRRNNELKNRENGNKVEDREGDRSVGSSQSPANVDEAATCSSSSTHEEMPEGKDSGEDISESSTTSLQFLPLNARPGVIREGSSMSIDVLDVEEVVETEINNKQTNIVKQIGEVQQQSQSQPFEMNNLDDEGRLPHSPCSLDYSCFSLSEIGTATAVSTANNTAGGTVSPLGEEEDSLILSPLTPCEATLQLKLEPCQKEELEGHVTLVVPWLTDEHDRILLYGTATVTDAKSGEEQVLPMFANQNEQEVYIRSWLAKEAGMPEEAKELEILFYPARYHKKHCSIFALGDICDLIDSSDVCILEEPEHLNWYRSPGSSSWVDNFCHCVGIIHTNYKSYARNHAPAGFLAAPLLASVNSLVVQANCHRVVKLSGVLQEFAPMSECVVNVHGIRETYLKEGQRRRASMTSVAQLTNTDQRRAYFIGKLLWAKGFDQLLALETSFKDRTGDHFEIDIYGSGPDEDEIKRAFSGSDSYEEGSGILHNLNKWSNSSNSGRRHRLPANFLGRVDHSSLAGDAYSIFINPSLTEVLCTTTAEAIAMGKWAIIPSHPSNAFFVMFPNCLPYRNRKEFVSTLKYAMSHDPPQLSDEQANMLSWEAATIRCVEAAAITKRDEARSKRLCDAKVTSGMKKTISGLWKSPKEGTLSPSSATSSEPFHYGSIPSISP